MTELTNSTATGTDAWLKRYYATRAIFSGAWVAAAFSLGRSVSPVAGILLAAYPAWDSIANIYDANRNGGLRANPTQAFNAFASAIVTIAIIFELVSGGHAILDVLGIWAALAGLMQLGTALRRWRGFGAQWPMILSGAQSTAAGIVFIKKAAAGIAPSPVDIAPYAAFGAVYFAISAVALAISAARTRRSPAAA